MKILLKRITNLSALIFCNVMLVFAQSTPTFMEYQNRSMAEVSKNGLLPQAKLLYSPQKVEVNATGSFHLGLPLMTVPGPGGLNFDITLNYTPGIKVTDEASWVGLGWNLDVGCITRNVEGGMDNTINKTHYRDLDDEKVYSDDQMRDIYSISCPGGSDRAMQFLNGDQYTFMLEELRPWRVTFEDSKHRFIVLTEDGTTYVFGLAVPGLSYNAFGDAIKGRLIYGVPWENPFMQWYLTAIIGPDYVDGGGDPLDPLDGDLPNKGNWIGIRWTYDGTRDFKKYFYREWNLPNYHYGRDISLTSMTYPLYIVTPTYVAKFETEDELWNPISELLDTKWGDFSRGGYGWQWDYNSYFASDGDDPPGVGQVKKRLKNIKLYRNYIGNGFRTITADQTILQQVDFIYQGHDPLYPDQPAPMENGYKEKRSLLKSVIITAGDITIPDYTFDYYDLIGNNDPFNHSWTYDWSRQNYAAAMFDPNYARVGFLGWYNSTDGGLEGKLNEFNYFIGNQTDGKMWNLEKITYPTGGSLVFDYESNCYMVNFSYRGAIDPITGEVAPIVSGAGSRLTSQIVNSGNIDSPSGIYTYEYGTDNSEFDPTFNLGVGRMYADPIDYYSAFPLCGGINCRSTIYPPQNDWYFHQTTHQVLYQQVLEHRPDGSIVKSYYGTAYLCEDIAPSGVGDVTSKMIFDNTMKRRGLLAKREYLSASRENLIKKEEFSIDEMMANSLMLNGPIFSYVKLSDGKITTQDRVVSSVTTEYSYTPGINDAIPNRTIITETNSEGSKKYTYLKYPGEFYQSNYAIAGLVSKNIVDVVLVKWIDDGNSVYAANAVAYKDFGPNDIHNIFPHPYRLFNSRNPEPISDRNYFDTRDYDMFQDWDTDMRFVRTQTFDDYDNFGNLLQSTDANGKTTKYVYDHNNGVRIADFQNLSAGPVYADNFDDGSISDNNPFSWTTTGLWALSNGILRSTNSAYAGNHTVEYQNFTTDVTLHIVNDYGSAANWAGIYFGSISTGDFSNGYILSYQNNGVLKLYKDGENLISVSTSLLPNVWRRLSVSVNGDNVQVYVDGKRFINYKLSSIATSGYIGLCTFDTDTEFDDFRSYPVGALARSYSCDPEKLLVIRATDENSISTNYKYDALGRVHSMLDYRKNPLQEIDYATDLRSIRTIDYLTPNLIKNPSFEDQRMIYRHEQSNNQLLPEEWLLEGCSSISDSMRVTFEKGYHGSCACLFNKGDKNSTFRLIQNIGKLKVGKSYRFIGFLDGGAYIDVYYSDGVHILSSSGTFNFSSPMDYTFTINRDEDVFIALYPSTDINWGAAYDYLGLFAVDDQYTSGSPIDLLPGYSETRNDWLGREIQSIVQQKGGESTSRGWIETNKYYDYLGRLTLSGFPYLSTEYPDTRFELFRNQIAYTDDPLNRIKEQGIDNSSTWGVGTDHSVKYFYSSNADDDPEYSGPGTLYKTRKINENGVSRDTYTDAFNNTIVTIVDPDELSLTTSFEYDIMGKLIRSVDPTELSSNYYYNTLGQMREKTTSDAGGVRYLYDKKGNLRLIKDAAHTITGIPTSIKSTPSSKIPNSGSMVPTISGYNDAIDITGGRNGVYTKLESVSMPRPGRIYIHLQMQYPLNGGLNIKLISGNGTVLLTSATSVYSNSYDVSMYLPKGSYTCEFQSTTAMTTSYSIKCSKWCEYVYNKYDEFDRVIETGEFEAPSEEDDFTQTNADNVTFPTDSCFVSKRFIYDTPSTDPMAANQRNIKGRLSTAISYRLGAIASTTIYSYDEFGRVEWVIQKGLNPAKKITYTYDLQGNITKKGYIDPANSKFCLYTFYTYDQAERLCRVGTNQNPKGVPVEDVEYTLNASGKPSRAVLGGGVHTIDYLYNERDWLTRIQSPMLDMTLDYNNGTQPQYNGNISSISYRMQGVNYTPPSSPSVSTDKVGYDYSYDGANRLTGAQFRYYYSNQWDSTNSYGAQYTYTGNGNINTAKVYGYADNVLMDDLQYKYARGKNWLTYIKDAAPPTEYTGDVENQEYRNYDYDGNGNMKQDLMSDIGFIIYDINNQPVTIYKKSDGRCYIYYYDAQGNRIRKNALTTESYILGADNKTETVIKSDNLHATHNIWGLDLLGQVKRDKQNWNRYYYLKDHLGTIRMTLDASGGLKSYDDFYPYGMVMENRSVNLGQSDTRYKFTAKERDIETGLDDFRARPYLSSIGRFLTPDPHAVKYPGMSSYAYCGNNPISFIDPMGTDSIKANNAFNNIVTWFTNTVSAMFASKNTTDQNTQDEQNNNNGTILDGNGTVVAMDQTAQVIENAGDIGVGVGYGSAIGQSNLVAYSSSLGLKKSLKGYTSITGNISQVLARQTVASLSVEKPLSGEGGGQVNFNIFSTSNSNISGITVGTGVVSVTTTARVDAVSTRTTYGLTVSVFGIYGNVFLTTPKNRNTY